MKGVEVSQIFIRIFFVLSIHHHERNTAAMVRDTEPVRVLLKQKLYYFLLRWVHEIEVQ